MRGGHAALVIEEIAELDRAGGARLLPGGDHRPVLDEKAIALP